MNIPSLEEPFIGEVEGNPDESRHRKILDNARKRLKIAIDHDGDNRRNALDDLRFVYEPGAQWPPEILNIRRSRNRPCLEINKMPTFIDQVVGDQRQNRPSIKCVPVDSVSDPKVANILTGWMKHVFNVSQADEAIDHSFEHAVACGYGAMRVVTRHTSDSSVEQDAYIEKIDNALAVWFGRHSKYDASDADYCFIVSDIDREEYKDKYGKDPMPFNEADSSFVEGWCTADTVRVVEYFVKEPLQKTLYLLADGRTVDNSYQFQETDQIVKTRTVKSHKVMWYLLSGDAVLDEREWVGKKYIPVVPVWGKEINVGGKRMIRSLIRFSKDPQRMLNYWQSCDTEQVALAPKAPYLATPKQISGHEEQWNTAHSENYPYLLVTPDEKAPGWPKREPPPQVSSAMVEKIRNADQDMRDTCGLQKASLGMQSNERSGVAIRERKQEGDTGTFAFIDNLSRSLEHLGRILVDIAPGLLDTERIIRIGLDDGSFKHEVVNKVTPAGIINDLSVGTYDIVVSSGPSFTTQRTEARQSMGEFIQYYPQSAPLIGDLYAKSMDWPGAEEMAERLEYTLPPEIKAKKQAERAEKNGEPPPQQNEQQPNPMEQLAIMEAQVKLEIEKAKLASVQLENEIKVLKIQQETSQIRTGRK